ncbi:MAG: TIGR00730 family Rossman fold protein [Parcubacteria group bacterium]|nr:TIGR00730 family Rossman fold protein [Parcubacteria group bacterium]
MNITIFCSANDVGESYTNAAREFATLIAKQGNTLVWGGSNKGTMKVIADAAQAAGGKIVGISVEKLKAAARPNADEMVITKDWPERRSTLLKRADAIVVLPGGLGTLDEITEVMEYKKHNLHNKAIVFLNTIGFYDGFKKQLERMDAEGFLPRALSEFLDFADSPADAMRYIERAHSKSA